MRIGSQKSPAARLLKRNRANPGPSIWISSDPAYCDSRGTSAISNATNETQKTHVTIVCSGSPSEMLVTIVGAISNANEAIAIPASPYMAVRIEPMTESS